MRKRCKRKVWAKVNPIQMAMEGAAVSSRDLLDNTERSGAERPTGAAS